VAVGIPADLLRRRPDIRRAEREVAAQSARIGIATSDLYPHISIAGSLYLDSANFSTLFNGESLAGNVGPSFRWDVLNYGRLQNNIRVQDARFLELAVTYQNLVLQANAEAENALVSFLKAQVQVKYLAESVSAAEQSVSLVRDQYDAGKTDFNRVLVIEQQLTQQQDQLAVAQGTVATSLVNVYKALGGGWQIRLGGPASPPNAAEGQDAEHVATPAPVEAKPPKPPETPPAAATAPAAKKP
jgi:outer membrane protein TolC